MSGPDDLLLLEPIDLMVAEPQKLPQHLGGIVTQLRLERVLPCLDAQLAACPASNAAPSWVRLLSIRCGDIRALRGVNRIIIAVEDLDESVTRYSELLGASFEDISWTGEPFGIRVAVSWDAGIELCAPMPGRQEDSIMSPFLAEHGEGIVNVVFGVDDADEARARAERSGVESLLPVDYSQEQIDEHLGGHFRTYKEHFLNSASRCGFIITLAQIDAKRDAPN